MKRRILYLGPKSGTCLDRANAYRRLGHDVHHLDTRKLLPGTVWVDRATWRVGGEIFAPWVHRGLARELAGRQYDVCHVDNGEWITPGVIEQLRRNAPIVINYNIDDPFGPRDGQRFSAYRKALPRYDLAVVVREVNVAEALNLGARDVLRVFRSADEVSHSPRLINDEDRSRWRSDVLFLGTWMPERGPFLLDLVERGVPLTIRGANWHKAPEWPRLRRFWKGGVLLGDEYAKAIQCARVNLGLLSKENRDQHTTRSLEIPALGALLCAERTDEHRAMYLDGVEAVFWTDPATCAAACLGLLADEDRRQEIAAHGRERLSRSGHFNERVLANVLEAACGAGLIARH